MTSRAILNGWPIGAGNPVASAPTPTPSPTLGALGLSATTFTIGTPASGTVTGATAGSTIAASGLPGGLTINGPARTFAWSGSGSAATTNITLTETLTGATNSPRTTNGLVTVAASMPAQANLIFDLDPATLTPQADNTNLASWPASIGGVTFDQATSARQPKYRTNASGSKPGVLFAQASQQVMIAPRASATALTNVIDAATRIYTTVVIATGTVTGSAANALLFGFDSSTCWLSAGTSGLGRGGSFTMPYSGTGLVLFGTCGDSSKSREQQFIQGLPVFSTTSSPPNSNSVANGDLKIGGSTASSTYISGTILRVLVFNKELTLAEQIQLQQWACDYFGQPYPWAGASYVYAGVGDSIEAGQGVGAAAGNNPVAQTAASLGLAYGQWTNLGRGGIRIGADTTTGDTMRTRTSLDIAPLASLGKPIKMTIGEYYNEAVGSSATDTQVVSRMTSYIGEVRTALSAVSSVKIALNFPSDHEASRNNVKRASVIASYASPGVGQDASVRIDQNANIGADGSCGATQPSTYFNDTIGHMVAAGYTVKAGIMTSVVSGM